MYVKVENILSYKYLKILNLLLFLHIKKGSLTSILRRQRLGVLSPRERDTRKNKVSGGLNSIIIL